MKINYAWIIIIILVIFMINKNMKNGTLDFDNVLGSKTP